MTDPPDLPAEHDDIEPEFRLAVRQEGGAPVLVVAGDVDLDTVDSLAAAIGALPADRPVVLDLAGVTFLDSVGLTLLVRTVRARDSRPDQVVLRHPRPGVLWVLETSGVATVLRIERADG